MNSTPRVRQPRKPPPPLRRGWVWIAIGGGLGLSPVAPGTIGSLAGPAMVAALLGGGISGWGLLAASVLLFLIGVPICEAGIRYYERADPPAVVWDEIAVFPLLYLFTPFNLTTAILGFVLFRIFDIAKPWPISRLERLPGGWGVMADDTLAGLFAAAGLHLLMLVGR